MQLLTTPLHQQEIEGSTQRVGHFRTDSWRKPAGRLIRLLVCAIAAALACAAPVCSCRVGAATEGRAQGGLAVGILGAVLEGLEAREAYADSWLRSLKGLWVEEAWSAPRELPPASTGPAQSSAAGSGSGSSTASVGTRSISEEPPSTTISRVFLMFEDENYISAQRVLKPSTEERVFKRGYVAGEAWAWDGAISRSARSPIAGLPGARLLGLKAVIPEEPEARLSRIVAQRQPEFLGEQSVSGLRCYLVGYSVPKGQSQQDRMERRIWVSPDRGYAVVREVAVADRVRFVRCYSDFRKVGGDFWLPFRYTGTREERDASGQWQPVSGVRAKVTSLRVNIPIPKQQFGPPSG